MPNTQTQRFALR